jgi:hypothetical protein
VATEIEAMSAIDKALAAMEPEAAQRVLRWAADKFGGGTIKVGAAGAFRRPAEGEQDAVEYQRISDLMDRAHPHSLVDHVLVASYWFQVVQGQENFTGQEVNDELKDLGHPSKNITDAYNSLMNRRPPAARQVQKTGSTKQARKRYRLTEVGVREVDRMIRGEPEE